MDLILSLAIAIYHFHQIRFSTPIKSGELDSEKESGDPFFILESTSGSVLDSACSCDSDIENYFFEPDIMKRDDFNNINQPKFIVFWSCLLSLFSSCFSCLSKINIACISKSRFFEVQKTLRFPVVNRFYKMLRDKIYEGYLNAVTNHFSGDGRCDSDNSNQMEKYHQSSLMLLFKL